MHKAWGVLIVTGLLMAWRAECPAQEQGESGLFSTPAFSGDFSGPYATPAFSGGRVGETAPATALGTGEGYRSRGQALPVFPAYGSGASDAYSTPTFQGPELGLLVTPRPARPEKHESKLGSSVTSGTSVPATPDAKPDPATELLGTATNHVGSVAPFLPFESRPPGSTNNLRQP